MQNCCRAVALQRLYNNSCVLKLALEQKYLQTLSLAGFMAYFLHLIIYYSGQPSINRDMKDGNRKGGYFWMEK